MIWKKEDNLKFDGIDFPVKLTDINKFEKLNPDIPETNVYGYENNVYPIRINKKRCF